MTENKGKEPSRSDNVVYVHLPNGPFAETLPMGCYDCLRSLDNPFGSIALAAWLLRNRPSNQASPSPISPSDANHAPADANERDDEK